MTRTGRIGAPSAAIHHQFARFVAIGLGSTLLDAAIYRLVLLIVSPSPAKAAGYVTGTAFSIACNYRWTFGYNGSDGQAVVVRCILLYATALVLNVAANAAAIAVLNIGALTLPIAFCFAVGVTTVYNFAGMRFWIFRKRSPDAGVAPVRPAD